MQFRRDSPECKLPSVCSEKKKYLRISPRDISNIFSFSRRIQERRWTIYLYVGCKVFSREQASYSTDKLSNLFPRRAHSLLFSLSFHISKRTMREAVGCKNSRFFRVTFHRQARGAQIRYSPRVFAGIDDFRCVDLRAMTLSFA